jgi:hypothetical protein
VGGRRKDEEGDGRDGSISRHQQRLGLCPRLTNNGNARSDRYTDGEGKWRRSDDRSERATISANTVMPVHTVKPDPLRNHARAATRD